ncbi:hypothetical protein CJ739_703 [Mariniflexile rhizosphaerae]|uniref:hypothetical protein n=1 Tax=Mariniflexile sp. TRM1-18 TaxID=3374233 RepID=UPI000E33407C|nr:hypothetical protein CJ739_703 [Mariniflexile sp. TRM1-10]
MKNLSYRTKMTSEKMRELLKTQAVDIDIELATEVLAFMKKLAKIAVSEYLKNEQNSRFIHKG